MSDFPHISFQLDGFDPDERIERGTRFRDWLDRRRSVRYFTDEPIDRACIELAIEAALSPLVTLAQYETDRAIRGGGFRSDR